MISQASFSSAGKSTQKLSSCHFAALTPDWREADVCPNKGARRWIVAAEEAQGLADQ